MRGVFITGTGTGVGKTLFAAGLAWCLRQKNLDVGVVKPFASSNRIFSRKFRSADVALLAKASATKETDIQINPEFYKAAAAPLMAAALTNTPPPSIPGALKKLASLAARHEFTIVEGIGGVLVPLTARYDLVDFMQLVGLPVVIVTTPFLGTVNSTLLTVGACRARGLRIAGLVVNMMPARPTRVEAAAPEFLATRARIPILAIIPRLARVNYVSVGRIIQNRFDITRLLSGKKPKA